jgi:hypothetical protein
MSKKHKKLQEKPEIKRGPGQPPLGDRKLQQVATRIPLSTLHTIEQTGLTVGKRNSPVLRYLIEKAVAAGLHLRFISEHPKYAVVTEEERPT